MKIEMAKLALDLPDGWEDRTSYCFAVPAEAFIGVAPLTGGSPANVAISLLPLPDVATDPVTFLSAVLRELAPSAAGFTLHSVAPLERADVRGAMARYRLVTTEAIEQIRVDVWRDDGIVSVVGSARQVCLAAFEPMFWPIVESARAT